MAMDEEVRKSLTEFIEAHKKMADAVKKSAEKAETETPVESDHDEIGSMDDLNLNTVSGILSAIRDVSGAAIVNLEIIEYDGKVTNLSVQEVEKEEDE